MCKAMEEMRIKKLLTFTLLERETDGYKRIYGYYQGSDKNI